ncbi:NAD(P)H nitroreductase [Pseudoalteromonas tunicata]|uniref:NAD(P)H nitroreductase n=1 Tax=Pseudoalteromonas tunicata TaxID=314281 RepID=UPI00273E3E5E|nr:NAD(P)H nitroreductase [Pseudoalteromonas tunicata]MDP4982287.1 NAD(P)H nitroreductase [Pseudoalteromonas tunicata]
MNALELLLTRQSDARLTEPGPNSEQLSIIKQAALLAPDHGALTPWQFIVVQGEGRERLGDVFYRSACHHQLDERNLERAKTLALRAPLVIICIAKYVENNKVPRIEQVQSAACAVFAMQQATFAQGLGGVWRTGHYAQCELIKAELGLNVDDEIVGYLYLGTPEVKHVKTRRLSTEQFFSDF